MTFTTADLYDRHSAEVQVALPMFRDYGGVRCFSGAISTVKVHEDNVLVREALEQPGDGRVLVVDGGGSMRCALVGDLLAYLGQKNGWAGILVYGCIRDSVEISRIAIGVKAMATNPRKSVKKGAGDRDIPVHFADVTRVLNIHPALLPSFPGLHAQRQALQYGVKVSGCTVHLADEGVDTGPILLQRAVEVLDGDTEESLSARILEQEHQIYWRAISLMLGKKHTGM